MIAVFIFFIHIVFVMTIFVKKKKEDGVNGGLLNIALIGILFAIGWSLTSVISKAIMEPAGFGKHFDRDTFSLALLTIVEFFFYRIYYKDTFLKKADKEKQ